MEAVYRLSRTVSRARGRVIIYSDASVAFVANISYLIKQTEKQGIIVFNMADLKVRVIFYYK